MCDHEDAPEGICDLCGAKCLAVWRDEGIGSYEYWGHVEFQEDWRWVSPCCRAEVVKPSEEDESCG